MTAPTVETQTLEFSTIINTSIEFLWSMLTNRDDLCDWLCDDAHVRVREGGFATFIWREPPTYTDGPHAYGVYQTVTEHEKLVMTWHDGTNQVTKVKFLIEEADDGFTIKVWHKGFTDSDRAAHYQSFWDSHLYTLKTMLETGKRPDITDRVIIGVMLDAGDTETVGHRVTRVVEGYSAASAGIQVDDVIIGVNGRDVTNETPIRGFITDKKPGDVVDVTFMRGEEKHVVSTALKGHPVPPIPATFEEMAQYNREEHERVNTALEPVLQGLTDEIETFKPDEDTWNIRDTLAHMVIHQRHTLEWMSTYATGPRRINPYYSDAARIQALIVAHPTASDLYAELKRTQVETIGMIHAFDKAMEQRKDYMWWLTYEKWMIESLLMQSIAEIEERKQQATA